MKKYLSKKLNILKLFSILIFILFFSSLVISFGQSKLDYYKKILTDQFGFRIFKSFNENVSPIEEFFEEGSLDKYLVLTSSMVNELRSNTDLFDIQSGVDIGVSGDSGGYTEFYSDTLKRVILICDEKYSPLFPYSYSCDENSVESRDLYQVGDILKSDNLKNVDLYVIPERLLQTPEGRESLGDYIKAIKRSDNAPIISEDAQVEQDKITLSEKLSLFSKSMTFEIFTISVSIFFLVLVTGGFIKILIREDKKNVWASIKKYLNVNNNLSLYQKIIFYVLVWAFVIYVVLLISLSLKDTGSIDIPYMLSYSIDSLNLKKVVELSATGGYFRLIIFLYEAVLLSMIIILFIPSLISILKTASLKITRVKFKSRIRKYSIPLLILILIVSSAFFSIKSLVAFQLFIIILITFLFLKNSQLGIDNYFYSRKEKFFLLSVSIISIFAGFFYNYKKGIAGPKYTKENLLGVSDKIVLLPYSKQLGENTLIEEYTYSGSEPLFVNNYMVYSPNNSKVENRNAKDFKDEGVFYIQNGDLEDIVSAIYYNDKLEEELISESPSNFFRVRNFKNTYDNSKADIEITFSCKRGDIGINTIKLDIYYFDKTGDLEEVKKDTKEILYFPGCTEINIPETVTVGIEIPNTESEYLYMRLVDVLRSDIKEIVVRSGGETIFPVYLSKSKGYSIIDSGGLTISSKVPVVNYIFGEPYEMSFDLSTDEDGEFDISVPINELVKQGVLKEKFVIWSTKKYLPMRMP